MRRAVRDASDCGVVEHATRATWVALVRRELAEPTAGIIYIYNRHGTLVREIRSRFAGARLNAAGLKLRAELREHRGD